MKTALIIAAALLLLAALIVWRRLRRRRRKYLLAGQEHPTGYLKYHEHTVTKLRAAYGEGDDKDKKDAKAIATFEFAGDMRATGRHSLSRIIDEVILNKEDFSEVVVRMESGGGTVTDYGHVYGEMCRIPAAGLKLTVCIDTVAASGGYLASLPAQQIIAAPFAMVGSIGVVSYVPNIRKLLERFDIQPRTFTAGEYKRTVTFTDENKPEQIEHYKQELALIHDQFKQALAKHRPGVDAAKVATGEAWLASTTQQKNLGLIDRIGVSADYLLELNRDFDILEFSEEEKKPLMKRLFKRLGGAALGSALGSVTDELPSKFC